MPRWRTLEEAASSPAAATYPALTQEGDAMPTGTLHSTDGTAAPVGLGTGNGFSRQRDVEVYQHVVRSGSVAPARLEEAAAALGMPVDEVFAAVARLVELRLLRSDELGVRLVPVDPQSAAALLVSPIERAIYQQRELADRLRERIETIARPAPGAQGPAGAIDVLEGTDEIRGLLKLAADGCREELTLVRPADDEQAFDELLEACFSVLDHSVRIRVVCPHRSRADFASRARVGRLIEAGADIRTVSRVTQASIVFDGSLAVMFGPADESGVPSARQVRDREVVRFLMGMFDQLWEGAAAYTPEEAGYAEDVADDLQRSIARLMAQGLTDEVVARRLGMSVRTCRRHIAALLRSLDSVSRFQAGVHAAHRLAAENAVAA
jgi:DNA-binding NarL/FixJ family response regulator